MEQKKNTAAVFMALSSVLFYAISIPVSKYLLKDVAPIMLASFLYLGAGIGVLLLSLCYRKRSPFQEPVLRKERPYLAGMVFCDILAAILLMQGMKRTTAANASLLANLEIVVTSLIAYFVFHERISKRMLAALALVTAAGAVLSLEGNGWMQFSAGSFLVIGSAVCWGIENNCTRMLSHKDTYFLVTVKGMCTGLGTLVIALLAREELPAAGNACGAMALGFFAYGMSIFAYIRAQHLMGAAKTSAFYSLSPFVSAFLSFLFLKEPLTSQYYPGFVLMILGTVLTILDLRHTQERQTGMNQPPEQP
jgi:drug/metabolite transporter (DMT)-like permease